MGDKNASGLAPVDQAEDPLAARTDLSAGVLFSDDATKTNLGLSEHQHRISLQRSAFSGAMSLAAILMMSALVVASWAMYLYASMSKFDWHATLLVGALVAPATFITVGLLRAAFPRQKGDADRDDSTGVISIDTLKELRDILNLFRGKD